MAKLGLILARATNDKGNVLSLREDRAILRQFRIDGKLDGAVIVARIATTDATGTAAIMVFQRYAAKYGYTGCGHSAR